MSLHCTFLCLKMWHTLIFYFKMYSIFLQACVDYKCVNASKLGYSGDVKTKCHDRAVSKMIMIMAFQWYGKKDCVLIPYYRTILVTKQYFFLLYLLQTEPVIVQD